MRLKKEIYYANVNLLVHKWAHLLLKVVMVKANTLFFDRNLTL